MRLNLHSKIEFEHNHLMMCLWASPIPGLMTFITEKYNWIVILGTAMKDAVLRNSK